MNSKNICILEPNPLGDVINHIEFCGLLKNYGFDFFVGVPCTILKNIINQLIENPKLTYITATKEDEALGIATGAYLGGRCPVVLMQNSGLGNSINALTSLDILYKFPILMIITWRGYLGKDAPEHSVMGKSMLNLLKVLKIPTKILSKQNIEDAVKYSVKTMKEKGTPVALILKKGVID